MLDMVSVCFCWVVPSTLVMSNFMGLKFSRILRDLKLAVFHITLCRVYIEHHGEDIHVKPWLRGFSVLCRESWGGKQ